MIHILGKQDMVPGAALIERRDGMIPYWSRVAVRTARGVFWARVTGAQDDETGEYPVKLELKDGKLGATQWIAEANIIRTEGRRVFTVAHPIASALA